MIAGGGTSRGPSGPATRSCSSTAKQRRHLITPGRGRRVPQPRRRARPRAAHRPGRGHHRAHHATRAMVAVRPTLAEYVLKMPRGAQVIYPKDLGPILMLADVFPGARVLESGVGSGALTMTLLRAIGPTGSVTGYELRDDFADRARRNVEGFLGPDVPLTIEVRDVYDGIDVDDLDRVVLDLPEPWRVVKHAETALRPGGILLSYLPTIGQVSTLREKLAARRSGWPSRSRSSSAAGTSTGSRSGPTTAWSPTPASSPCAPEARARPNERARRRDPRGGRRRGLRRVPARVRGPGAVLGRARRSGSWSGCGSPRASPRSPPTARPVSACSRSRRSSSGSGCSATRTGLVASQTIRQRYSLPRARRAGRPDRRRAPRCARCARAPVAAAPGAALDARVGRPARPATRSSSPRSTATRRSRRRRARERRADGRRGAVPAVRATRGSTTRPPTTDAGPPRRHRGRPARSCGSRARRADSSDGHRLRGRARPRRDERARGRGGARPRRSSPSTATRTTPPSCLRPPPRPRDPPRRRSAAAGPRRSGRPRSGPWARCSATRTAVRCGRRRPGSSGGSTRPRTDIYRTARSRPRSCGLAAHLIAGRLGRAPRRPGREGPGVAFAVDPADADTAYALTSDELAPFVRAAHPATTPSPPAPAWSAEAPNRRAKPRDQKPNQDGRSRRTRPGRARRPRPRR